MLLLLLHPRLHRTHLHYLTHLAERTRAKLGIKKIFFPPGAEGISELVGTMFTVKYFAQASLPLLPRALPPHFAENMFNLTGVNR